MGRLFSMLLLWAVMLIPAKGWQSIPVQPVFFSMLFPQLIPDFLMEERAEGAVFL